LAFLRTIPDSKIADHDLIENYKQSGDLSLLAALYEPYMESIYLVCFKYLKQQELAKDAVMAIFEELILKLKKHEVTYFKGWLHTLAKNHCLIQLRSAKHIKTTEMDPDRMQLTEEMHLNGNPEIEEDLALLGKCMETLSAEQKMTVELFYFQDKCYKEITAMTGLPWNQVRSHIQNGKRNLKICLEAKTVTS
jgi:RNA polymerase sigma factor (sigma-70 family)